MIEFEAWKDPITGVVFQFSHSDENLTTGVMMLPSKSELPKHNRPKAFENLLQVAGKCEMTVFKGDETTKHVLEPGSSLRMEKGQHHIHANPYDEPSYTLFKAEGDITEIMTVLRANFEKVEQ